MTKFPRAVLTLALAGAASAAGPATAAQLDRSDTRFMQEAAAAGQFEIAASQLAADKGSHPDVKAFASMMITDHTKAGDELKALAGSKNVQLPAEPSGKMRSELDKLQKKSGTDFDREYADEVAVDAHKDAVKLFQSQAKDAKDPDVKAYAVKYLPVLQQHLARGREVESLVKSTRDNAKMSR